MRGPFDGIDYLEFNGHHPNCPDAANPCGEIPAPVCQCDVLPALTEAQLRRIRLDREERQRQGRSRLEGPEGTLTGRIWHNGEREPVGPREHARRVSPVVAALGGLLLSIAGPGVLAGDYEELGFDYAASERRLLDQMSPEERRQWGQEPTDELSGSGSDRPGEPPAPAE